MAGISYKQLGTEFWTSGRAVMRRTFGRLTLVSLLIVVLVASVLLPALESQRIMRLLQEIAEVIEPARNLSWRLESGLGTEYSALQSYALTGDSVLLIHYQTMVSEETREVDSLQTLVTRIDPGVAESASLVGQRIRRWQELNGALVAKDLSREDFANEMKAQRVLRDSIINEIDLLPAQLSAEAAARRDRVGVSEQRSLLINAGLVIVALGAVAVVVALTRRERRLAALLQRRAEQEAALRHAAEALAGAFTIDDVTQELARSALDATQAKGVRVEYVSAGEDGSLVSVVRGAAGSAEAELGASQAYAGSYTERVINAGLPTMLADLQQSDPALSVRPPDHGARSTIVVPFGSPAAPRGALFIVGTPPDRVLLADTAWTHTFAHLAALAYEKVRLLDEAREGRRELERLMRSRQRLMRGFSHDVKNPLGAADGYAELLRSGIYGEVSAEQSQSIERIRRSIHRALSLIDDLHELARAETGNISLHLEAVDMVELARTSAEEYRGAATAAGLALNLEVADDLPTVVTDGTRVNQIVGNLLSNAIKYTKSGSVTLRVRSEAVTPGVDGGDVVEFGVIDTGIGIPADKKDVIFEEFTRLGASDRPGAGLGLAISKRIAEVLGGEISFKGGAGRGSTFTLRIPSYMAEDSIKSGEPRRAPPSLMLREDNGPHVST
jgi:signal transduction histidine kinase/CHASE3 domain sensor protein